MARKRDWIMKLVGKDTDGSFVFCESIFEYEDGLKGAAGFTLRPITEEEYERRTDPEDPDTLDYFEEFWCDAVRAGWTRESLEEYTKRVLAKDGDNIVFDLSYFWDVENQLRDIGYSEEDYPIFECIGSGRCFDKDSKYEVVYDSELLDRIRKIEEN